MVRHLEENQEAIGAHDLPVDVVQVDHGLTISLLPVLAVYLLLQRRITSGMTAGGAEVSVPARYCSPCVASTSPQPLKGIR